MGWMLVRFGRSGFVALASMWIFGGVLWAHFVRESESRWVPIMLSVGLLGVLCLMICDLMVERRDSGGVYEKEASPRGAPPNPALADASAGEHLVGVFDDILLQARKDIGAALAEFREEVRGFRQERRERKERERMSL